MMKELQYQISCSNLNQFIHPHKSRIICFRCGEPGHMRAQCLTYKIRMCPTSENGSCSTLRCPFAHKESEMRTPWRVRCVRVVKHNGELMCIGCNSTSHTFRQCPHHRDLLL